MTAKDGKDGWNQRAGAKVGTWSMSCTVLSEKLLCSEQVNKIHANISCFFMSFNLFRLQQAVKSATLEIQQQIWVCQPLPLTPGDFFS